MSLSEPVFQEYDTNNSLHLFRSWFTGFKRCDPDDIVFTANTDIRCDLYNIIGGTYELWYLRGRPFLLSTDCSIIKVLNHYSYSEVHDLILHTFGIEGEDTIYTNEKIYRDETSYEIKATKLQPYDITYVHYKRYGSINIIVKVKVTHISDPCNVDCGIKGDILEVVFDPNSNQVKQVGDDLYFGIDDLLGEQEYVSV